AGRKPTRSPVKVASWAQQEKTVDNASFSFSDGPRPWGRRWQLEMANTRSVYETRFEAAVKVIQSLPKNGSFQPTNEMMLKLYSFYKQMPLTSLHKLLRGDSILE
ncbi:hypothetical protein STEG23_017774, partial [Scotinomys teguina]